MGDDAATVEQLRAELRQAREANAALRSDGERRGRALDEVHEQQAAIIEILRALVASGGDAETILQAIAEHATRIGRADDTLVYRLDGDVVRFLAHHGSFSIIVDRASAWPLSERRVVNEAIRERRPVHVPDFGAVAPARYPDAYAFGVRAGIVHRSRTWLAVPLLLGDAAIGALVVQRSTVAPFDDREIAVVEAFAAEAALAIENARLFEELEQRNRELSEALEQQTATAEILRVIASSPGDLRTVLNTIAQSAARLTSASTASVWRLDGDLVRLSGRWSALVAPLTDEQMREHTRPLVQLGSSHWTVALLAAVPSSSLV